MSDRMFWFLRNLGALLCWLLVLPIYTAMDALETITFAVWLTIKSDGSETLEWPWDYRWPFFRGDD